MPGGRGNNSVRGTCREIVSRAPPSAVRVTSPFCLLRAGLYLPGRSATVIGLTVALCKPRFRCEEGKHTVFPLPFIGGSRTRPSVGSWMRQKFSVLFSRNFPRRRGDEAVERRLPAESRNEFGPHQAAFHLTISVVAVFRNELEDPTRTRSLCGVVSTSGGRSAPRRRRPSPRTMRCASAGINSGIRATRRLRSWPGEPVCSAPRHHQLLGPAKYAYFRSASYSMS
jgi:hypothetical protein